MNQLAYLEVNEHYQPYKQSLGIHYCTLTHPNGFKECFETDLPIKELIQDIKLKCHFDKIKYYYLCDVYVA